MLIDETGIPLDDEAEKWLAVLGHASAHLAALPDDASEKVRRFLMDEFRVDPTLVDDGDKVGRICERVAKTISKAEDDRAVKPATELKF